jgi:hypothetical protein
MSRTCWNFRHVCFSVWVLTTVTMSVHAELVGDVKQFIADRDRLEVVRNEIAADRAAMAADLNNEQRLRTDVRRFFSDRDEVLSLRVLKAADRKQMRISLSFKGERVNKPTKGTGDLLLDATSYIFHYDRWNTLRQTVDSNVEQMRVDANAGNVTALTASTTSFFENSRLRFQARVQWQSDIRAMKKDIGFKGTGKALPPPGSTLQEHTTEFLADRAAWEALGLTVEADRNNLRSAIGTSSLESVVRTFLTDRRARHVKGVELAMDRAAMRADVGIRAAKEEKLGAMASSRDIDKDDEDSALESSADGAGE